MMIKKIIINARDWWDGLVCKDICFSKCSNLSSIPKTYILTFAENQIKSTINYEKWNGFMFCSIKYLSKI